MNLRLEEITDDNFWDVINLKSDEAQKQKIQIFERWVGSNTFFLALSKVYEFTAKAIYDGRELIGFVSYGYQKEQDRYELISMMLGYQHQGKGYGLPTLKLIIGSMVQDYSCKEIYLSVIHDNEQAIRLYKKVGFEPTGEVEQGHHPEPIFRLTLN